MEQVSVSSMRSRPFQVPRLPRQVIARPRLTNRLHAAVGNGLTLLQAPAGTGKTVLLTQFALEVETDFEARWLSIDNSCKSPEIMAERIARALTADLSYPAPAVAGDTANLRAYLGASIRTATTASERPLLLVLDNFHEIERDDAAGEIVSFVLEALPQGSEVIIASREPIELDGVDELLLEGSVVLLGASDLAFNRQEVDDLVQYTESTRKGSDVFEAAGGWPVGTMAVLRGTLRGAPGRRLEMGEAWERYIVREVWEAIPEDVQQSLLSLSSATVIERELATAIIGQHAWWRLHDWLSGHDILVEHFENGGIRINGLLRQFMVSRFRRVRPAEYESAAWIIAEHFEKSGAVPEALAAAAAAESSDLVATLLERHGHALFMQGSFAVLISAFQSVSDTRLNTSPLLAGLRARTLAHAGSPIEALDMAERVLATSDAAASRHHASLARRRVFRLLGRIDEIETILLPDPADHNPLLQAEIAYAEAELQGVVRGNYSRAMPLLQQAANLAREGNVKSLELLARSTLGEFLAARGDMPAAITELTAAAQGWRAIRGTANLGWTLNNLGFAHMTAGDFESAVTVLSEAVSEGEQCGNVRNSAYARASLAEAKTALGRYSEAVSDYEQILQLCSSVPDGTLACASMIGFSQAALGAGDVSQADYLARQALVLGESLQMPVYHALAYQQVGMVLLHAGEIAPAVQSLEMAVRMLDETQSTTEKMVAQYRLAMCYFRASRRADANRALIVLDEMLTEPWMAGPLIPAAREQPMFAQWAAARPNGNAALKNIVQRGAFRSTDQDIEVQSTSRLPVVKAESMGRVRVLIDGREVSDENWASARAKEMFFLLLANRNGIRKEEAVEHLYPELPAEKCNSAFHSNLYRVRKALYQESVVKRDGIYLLNPDGQFEWDVEEFEDAMTRASRQPAGSEDRAQAYSKALLMYRGPFAELFYSEWAESLRHRIESRSLEAISLLAGFHAGQGNFEEAATTLERVLERDEFNEEAIYQVAVYRARAGQGATALRFIDRCRERWQVEYKEEMPQRFSFLRASIASGKAV